MTNLSKRIARPAETPVEVYNYWHRRWAEYLNQHYREHFLQAGFINISFTERCTDCPDGSEAFHYHFSSDGTIEFVDHEGEAIIEYDSYDIAYRLLGDESYNTAEALGRGELRFIQGIEHFVKLGELLPLMREAFYVAIAEAEKKFNIEMPKYSGH